MLGRAISIFFFLTVLRSPLAFAAPDFGSCGFYDSYAESLGCGADTLIGGLAPRACRAYDEHREDFSAVGQTVLASIKLCLQTEIDRAPLASCADADAAFLQAHRTCYVALGYCSLPMSDRWRIVEIAGLDLLTHPELQATALGIQRQCWTP